MAESGAAANLREQEGKYWAVELPTSCIEKAQALIKNRAANTRTVAKVYNTPVGVVLVRWTECKYNTMISWVGTALAELKKLSKSDWKMKLADPSTVPRTSTSASDVSAEASGVSPGSRALASPAAAEAIAEPSNPTWLAMKAVSQSYDLHDEAKEAAILKLGKGIGEGTFGVVVRGVHNLHGDVVVKTLKSNNGFRDFLKELLVVDRLRHSKIVDLIDCLSYQDGPYRLLFRDAGRSLTDWYRSDSWTRNRVPCIMQQICGGLGYCHQRFVAHTDIKPNNICIDSEGQVKLCDFGNALYCVPGHRRLQTVAEVKKTGLRYCSLWWRAPEILLGDLSFNTPCDVWAAGCVLVELAAKAPMFPGDSAIGTMMLILQFVGEPDLPTLEYLRSLPHWSQHFPSFKRKAAAWKKLNLFKNEALFLEGAFALKPSARLTASEAVFAVGDDEEVAEYRPDPLKAESPLELAAGATSAGAAAGPEAAAKLEVYRVQGCNMWQGGRGPYALASGTLSRDVLLWLRGDEWFQDGGASLPINFVDEGKYGLCGLARRRYEAECKLEIAGHMSPGAAVKRRGLTANGVDASEPMFERARFFNKAFKLKNKDELQSVEADFRRSLRKLTADSRGENGEFLLAHDVFDWGFDLATLQFMSVGKRTDPLHWDGGASALAYILTLWGHRSCSFLNADDTYTEFQSKSGTMYTGGFCAAQHFVTHPADQVGDEVFDSAVGPCEVVLCVRSRVFRGNRASGGKTGPTPRVVADAVLGAVRKAALGGRFALPTLKECEAVAAGEEPRTPMKSPSGLQGQKREPRDFRLCCRYCVAELVALIY